MGGGATISPRIQKRANALYVHVGLPHLLRLQARFGRRHNAAIAGLVGRVEPALEQAVVTAALSAAAKALAALARAGVENSGISNCLGSVHAASSFSNFLSSQSGRCVY